jgi:nucleotidyltransferase substrate binding protein (TIGR01987 family)
MKIDFSSFKKALASLERAIKRSRANSSDEELRDAAIQRFEYTYELSWKMLKRTLEQEAANSADIDQMSFKELIRAGAERGFLSNVEKWFTYRELRNLTSHVYDPVKAQEVYKEVLSFYEDAAQLLKRLEERKDA